MTLSKLKSFLKQFPFIYPARIITSCKEWIDKENLKHGVYAGNRKYTYKLIEPAEYHTHPLPALAADNDAQKFSSNIFYQTAPGYLFYLDDCYIFKQSGLILTNRNALFQEFTHHFNIDQLSRFVFKNPFYTFSARVKKIDGIGAVLLSPQSHNYYHWLFDVLPRIKLYGSVLGHIDHFCISEQVPQKFLEILPAFGIPVSKILVVNNTEKLHFNNLYVASLAGSEGRSPQWGMDFVRSALIKTTPAEMKKKIYFKRGFSAQRRILNEDEIIELLKDQGFDIIEPDSLIIMQQVSLMQQAAIVVAAHGAALSNLMFATRGATVIEIFSPDYFRTDCYFTLSRLLNLNYYYLEGTKPANAQWGEILINEKSLMALLNSLL